MGLRGFLRSVVHTIKLTRKSDRDEFILYLKLVLLGLGAVGTIGFVIQLVSALLKLSGG